MQETVDGNLEWTTSDSPTKITFSTQSEKFDKIILFRNKRSESIEFVITDDIHLSFQDTYGQFVFSKDNNEDNIMFSFFNYLHNKN